MQISRNVTRTIAYCDFLASVALASWGLYLATSPLHPLPGDSHGGLMAVFPGLLLIALAALAYGSGKLLLHQHALGWFLQAAVVACLGFLAFILFS
jgi:hypothetical protein